MNSMIPLMGRQPQINDPLEVAGNAASLSNLLQLNQMRQRQMDAEDAQRAAMQQRLLLGKRAYQEAADTYNRQNSAARTAAATAAANAPQEMPPGSPMPGAANSPLVQGAEASPYVPAEGADAAIKPVAAVGNNMMSDPKFHEIFALTAKDYGLDDIAEMAMKHRSDLLKEQAPQSEPGKIARDFGGKGAAMEAMGRIAVWNKVKGNPPEGFAWDPETGEPKPMKEVQALMIKLREKGAARNSVTVNNKTEGKYGEALAVKQADKDIQLQTAAEKAPEAIERVQRLRKVLREGDVFTGTGAETKLAAAKLFSALGVTINDQAIANTEEFVTGFATNTLDAISTSGLGTGNGFTGKDLEFLQKAKGGQITFSRENIDNMLRINESVHRAAQRKWSSRYKTMPQDARDTLGLEEPTEAAPAAPSRSPRPGDVEMGHRFKGGDPSDPNSWEQL